MQPEDAPEMMDQDRTRNRFKQRAAVTIAILAMVLAIASLGGANAGKEAMNNNVLASNFFNFYQAKNMRQTSYELALEQFELAFAADPAFSEEAKAALKNRAEAYRATVARYESEPGTGEGKKELLARAKEHEVQRDRALKQDPYFDYAEALLQIGIVVVSVSIVAEIAWLAFIGGALGVLGLALTINGFLLLVAIPGLA